MKSMSVVSSELWVGTLEGWISGGLWLLDTVSRPMSARALPSYISVHRIAEN